jgi:RimJ/RimL family protein N-acetyltransferase
MSALVEIRPATAADALALVLRRADREEVEALTGRDPHEALVASVERSAAAWAGLADGELVCLFGIVPMTLVGVTGIPWLLGAESVTRYGRPFLRRNRAWLREMLREFPVLRNVVDARNTVSIRWLEWLGFTLGAPQPMGARGLPFIPFEMRAPL